MTEQNQITPSPELKQQWREQAPRYRYGGLGRELWLIDRAAEWGYDQRGEVNEAKLQQARDEELEACIAWMKRMGYWGEDGQAIPLLRAARRPKPPSLKEQALGLLNEGPASDLLDHEVAVIRRALEALPDE